jgi:DNA-binding CsgD family transcriptional regulator
MPIGVAFLNADGGVVAANRLAQGVINGGEGLYVANGGLAVELGGRRLKMRDLVAQLGAAGRTEGQRRQPLMVVRHSGKRPLTLLLSAVDERDDYAADIEAILFVGDPERPATFDHVRITKLYGLSKAESRVAALLASGYRLEQAAEILGVAYETVRKHLKQIFSKTGTYRQAELVRMIVTGPAGLMI